MIPERGVGDEYQRADGLASVTQRCNCTTSLHQQGSEELPMLKTVDFRPDGKRVVQSWP